MFCHFCGMNQGTTMGTRLWTSPSHTLVKIFSHGGFQFLDASVDPFWIWRNLFLVMARRHGWELPAHTFQVHIYCLLIFVLNIALKCVRFWFCVCWLIIMYFSAFYVSVFSCHVTKEACHSFASGLSVSHNHFVIGGRTWTILNSNNFHQLLILILTHGWIIEQIKQSIVVTKKGKKQNKP